jgi:hypothetical protein
MPASARQFHRAAGIGGAGCTSWQAMGMSRPTTSQLLVAEHLATRGVRHCSANQLWCRIRETMIHVHRSAAVGNTEHDWPCSWTGSFDPTMAACPLIVRKGRLGLRQTLVGCVKAGNARAISWIVRRTQGSVLAAVEGTSSYGASITAALIEEGLDIAEIRPAPRSTHAHAGKSEC